MLRFVTVLATLANPTFADVVKVTSGEHADFSRLVLALPETADWQLGRTSDGYELALSGDAVQYDVSRVFDLIPRTRLTGIFADPESGHLNLNVGCDCHAIPFALDATTIVIDLRDGTPPATSAFEAGLDGQTFAPLRTSDVAAVRPRPRLTGPVETAEFDWTKIEVPVPQARILPSIETLVNAEDLRQVLVEQLADGAARSVIELSIPQEPIEVASPPHLADNAPIRISNEVGLQVYSDRAEREAMRPDGELCLTDAQLNLAEWGSPDLMVSGVYLDLVGEFDVPQTPQVFTAAKQLLYLGFGAEARNLLQALSSSSEETAMLTDLALLLDGAPMPNQTNFRGMESCDSAAALWAFLAANSSDLENPNLPAIKRTFSALPPHLRMHLGHVLVERLVARNEIGAAVEVSQAMQRGLVQDDASIAMASAEVLLSTGAAARAVDSLESAAATPGVHQARAIAALVTAKIAAEEPIAPEQAATLGAFVEEYAGNPIHAELAHAYALALAGSGQFEKAFALSALTSGPNSEVWDLLAKSGTDDQLLTFAIQPPKEETTAIAAQQIADRLEVLGFKEQASLWRIAHELSQEGGFGEVQPEPVTERDEATNDLRADRWREDWQSVAANNDGIWSDIAQEIMPSDRLPFEPSLAGATQVLQQSKDTRALVSALFSEVSGVSESP